MVLGGASPQRGLTPPMSLFPFRNPLLKIDYFECTYREKKETLQAPDLSNPESKSFID
jgi:hypothetical protein